MEFGPLGDMMQTSRGHQQTHYKHTDTLHTSSSNSRTAIPNYGHVGLCSGIAVPKFIEQTGSHDDGSDSSGSAGQGEGQQYKHKPRRPHREHFQIPVGAAIRPAASLRREHLSHGASTGMSTNTPMALPRLSPPVHPWAQESHSDRHSRQKLLVRPEGKSRSKGRQLPLKTNVKTATAQSTEPSFAVLRPKPEKA
ncbi:hypothetical protein Anapl_05583 [Anas platyrhynchos]|uniref:Uncharacterized protein n=1 Tax=Anas platyrhynchos TaxID=8839 RepID=R0K0I4_ANAPL|nr:hypothetical protein Anapl_05583 [Anas platyrhynchos]